MKNHLQIAGMVACAMLFFSLLPLTANAQLNQTFDDMFNYFLRERLDRQDQIFHGQHYFPAADLAEEQLTPALNSLIASNISSFPLSSTIAGLSLDFSGGQAVLTSESLGPIFAETAESIGPGKIHIGISYSHMSLNKLRGLDVDDIRFTFIHQDVTPTPPFGEDEQGSLGNPAWEADAIEVYPNLNINSEIFAFTFSFGVLDNLDISLAIPIVNVSLSGTARAIIDTYSYGRLNPARPEFQGASHTFGGTMLDPILEADTTFSNSTNGIGDVAVRVKYVFLQNPTVNMAAMLDARIPSGDQANFLGTGDPNFRVLWIMSGRFGEFNPHFNFGYDQRGASLDSDEFEYIIGFDQKLSNNATFAIDLLGTYDLDTDERVVLLPGSVEILEPFEGGQATRFFDLSNIPDATRDNTLDLSVGLRYAPSEKIVIMGNILTPLNDHGLRSSIVPTLGISISV